MSMRCTRDHNAIQYVATLTTKRNVNDLVWNETQMNYELNWNWCNCVTDEKKWSVGDMKLLKNFLNDYEA